MKKTFQLRIEGKHPDRVLDAIKHEVRQYVRRERRRPLPPGVDFLDFDCRFGQTAELAAPAHLAALTALMDAAAQAGELQFYVEVVAKPGYRQAKPGLAASVPASDLRASGAGGAPTAS